MHKCKLIIISGQEGAGKSTLARALLPHTPNSVRIDGEDIAQINPCHMDASFFQLLRENVAMLSRNYWQAGYTTVIAASFLNNFDEYTRFRALLPDAVEINFVHLCASKEIRDRRRVERPKPSTAEWRDYIDQLYPEASSLDTNAADYRYIRVENSHSSIDETVLMVKQAIPEVYAGGTVAT